MTVGHAAVGIATAKIPSQLTSTWIAGPLVFSGIVYAPDRKRVMQGQEAG